MINCDSPNCNSPVYYISMQHILCVRCLVLLFTKQVEKAEQVIDAQKGG